MLAAAFLNRRGGKDTADWELPFGKTLPRLKYSVTWLEYRILGLVVSILSGFLGADPLCP